MIIIKKKTTIRTHWRVKEIRRERITQRMEEKMVFHG